MTEQDIYIIAKEWIGKDHEDSAVDWVKLMAADLSRRFEYEKSKLKNHGVIGDDVMSFSAADMQRAYNNGSEDYSTHRSRFFDIKDYS